MRRPITVPLCGLALGIFLAGETGILQGMTNGYLKIAEAVMIATCIIAASIFVKKGNGAGLKEQLLILVISVQLGIILLTSAANGIERDLDLALSESDGRVSGVITEVDVKQDYVGFVLACDAGYKVQVSVYGDNIGLNNPGDATRFEGCEAVFYGKVEEPKGQRNPHCFDYKQYLSTKGICAAVSSKAYEIGEVKRPIRHRFAVWKAEFTDRIAGFANAECAGLISGILFGEKGGIDEDTYDMFKKNGTAHILAVSGLHIGIVYGFAVKLSRRRRTRKARIFSAAFVLLYIAIAGFSASVTRAGAMILLHILSKELRMRYDVLSAAAGVCIANLVINPLMLWNTGFQLSYLAIFTICFVTHRFVSGETAGKGIKQALVGSFAVQLGIAPYTAFQFNYFSLVSIVLNIPVIFIAGLLVPLAIAMLYVMGIIAILPGIDFESVAKLFEFGTFILEKLSMCLVKLNDLAFMGGHSHFVCTSPPVWALGLYYGILFFLCSEVGFIMFARQNIKRIATCFAIIIALSFSANAIYTGPADRAGIVFVDVGQGDCMHLRVGGKNVLVDSGGSHFTEVGEKTLKPYLLKNGCAELDLVVITHLHTDHCKGIDEICDEIEVKNLCVYEGYSADNVREALPNYRGKVTFLKKGDILRIADGVSVEILAPEGCAKAAGSANEDDENSMSLIAKVDYKGLTAMMTADIDEAGERTLMQAYSGAGAEKLRCDILKIAHHGSKYSSCDEFLTAVCPSAAVIQVGKNNYGHPSDDTLDRCASHAIPIYRSDQNGAIYAYDIKNGTYKICQVINN